MAKPTNRTMQDVLKNSRAAFMNSIGAGPGTLPAAGAEAKAKPRKNPAAVGRENAGGPRGGQRKEPPASGRFVRPSAV